MTTATETTTAKIFVTDYASYNNGTQFQFGHWAELSDFSDADEFNQYVSDHLEECDKKSPLDEYGSKREEPMFTDYEGFPEQWYGESGCDLEKIFKYMEIDFENMDDSEKIQKWGEYCSENNIDSEIYDFDEHFFDTFYSGKPMEAARAATFGHINWSHDYIYFNGYGNLETTDDATSQIDEKELLNWLMENA